MRRHETAFRIIAQSLNYDDLPEVWRIPHIARFSHAKKLYDYQQDALKKAARALFLYYGKDEQRWRPNEKPNAQEKELSLNCILQRQFSD